MRNPRFALGGRPVVGERKTRTDTCRATRIVTGAHVPSPSMGILLALYLVPQTGGKERVDSGRIARNRLQSSEGGALISAESIETACGGCPFPPRYERENEHSLSWSPSRALG